jgi:tetratricopeptide (TPR) repeat protein
LKEEQDERRLRDRALGNILDFADHQQKRLLFIVENLQMLLGEQISDSDAWDLRGTLQNEPRMMLLATATTRFSQIEKVDKAFYDVFKPLELQPLDEEACENFWEARTGVRLTRRQMRPISILTGGNPRLLAIIAGFAAKTSFEDLMSNLTHLVDEHTDYFKSYLDNMPVQGRKVFVSLAEIWDPATAREVAKTARMEVSKTSAQLLRLADEGRVLVETKGKRQRYQVAERMYNIYYLMRNRGNQRIQVLVRFMLFFYSQKQLREIVPILVKEYLNCPPEKRTDFDHFISNLLDNVSNPALKMKIVNTALEFINNKVQQGDEYLSLLKQGREMIEQGHYEDAEKILHKAIEIDPDKSATWVLLGYIFREKSERFVEAENAYRKAIELRSNDAWAWEQLGELLHEKLERYAEAEVAYSKAIELEPNDAWAWGQLGLLLHEKLERYEEAEIAFRKAIELKSDNATYWFYLGRLLQEGFKRYDEAETAFYKIVELEPNAINISILSVLLYEQKKYQEIIDLLRKAKPYDENQVEMAKIQPVIIIFLSALAAEGYSKEILTALQKSSSSQQLEPLICALRMDLGEEVNIAQEIKEVAKDILVNIEERRKKSENKLAPEENKA